MNEIQNMANELLNLADEARKVAKGFDASIDRISIIISDHGQSIIMQTKDGQEIDIGDDGDELWCSSHVGQDGWHHWERMKRHKAG